MQLISSRLGASKFSPRSNPNLSRYVFRGWCSQYLQLSMIFSSWNIVCVVILSMGFQQYKTGLWVFYLKISSSPRDLSFVGRTLLQWWLLSSISIDVPLLLSLAERRVVLWCLIIFCPSPLSFFVSIYMTFICSFTLASCTHSWICCCLWVRTPWLCLFK